MKELKELLNKRFSVYVNNEFEGYTTFLGVMKRLSNFSDFLDYPNKEQKEIIKLWFDKGFIYVDSQIHINFKKDIKEKN